MALAQGEWAGAQAWYGRGMRLEWPDSRVAEHLDQRGRGDDDGVHFLGRTVAASAN